MTGFGIPLQRVVLIGLLPLMALLFWSGSADPINVPKATAAALAAVLVLVVGVIRILATRKLLLPLTPSVWAATALLLALAVATVTSDLPGASYAGAPGRNDGLLLYSACLVLFAVGVRVFDAESIRWLLFGLMAGGLFAATYGLLQYAHIDAIHWTNNGISPVIATFGNPDFESAYVGIVIPAAAWGALTRSWSVLLRAASALLLVLCLVVAVLTSSVQGVLAGGAGLVVCGIALLLNRGDVLAKRGLLALLGLAGLVAAVVALGVLAGVGPGERIIRSGSLTARKWYWQSAITMWKHHPLTGVGLDRYGAYFRAVRPDAAAAVSDYSDAAHSVPLHLLATGGLIVAVPYVAFVILVVVALVQGLRRLDGEARLLLGGVGGAWTAYQVQSLVSIDQPGLAVTHWVLAGAVVALAVGPRLYERLLPGAVKPVPRKGRSTPRPGPAPVTWTGLTAALSAVVVVVGALLAWQVLKPLRADHASQAGAFALLAGQGNAAYDAMQKATRLAPYQSAYWLQQGRFLEQVKQPALAAEAFAKGAQHDPRAYDVLVAGALLAKSRNDATALTHYSQLLSAVDRSGGWRKVLGG